jgi:hypothetical protein
VAVRYGLEDLLTEPLPEFYHPLLMAGGAEVPAFAREGHEILVATIFAFNAGKTIVEDAEIKIAVDHLLHIGAEEAILCAEEFLIDLFKFLKVILNAPVILGTLRIAGAAYGRTIRHAPKAFLIAAGVGFPDDACPGTQSSEPLA